MRKQLTFWTISLVWVLMAEALIHVLPATLASVSLAFGTFGSADKSKSLALPEGSIRELVALSLIVLFAILALFLFEIPNIGESRAMTETLLSLYKV